MLHKLKIVLAFPFLYIYIYAYAMNMIQEIKNMRSQSQQIKERTYCDCTCISILEDSTHILPFPFPFRGLRFQLANKACIPSTFHGNLLASIPLSSPSHYLPWWTVSHSALQLLPVEKEPENVKNPSQEKRKIYNEKKEICSETDWSRRWRAS